MKNKILAIVLTSPLIIISGGIFKTSYDYFKVDNLLYSILLFTLSFVIFHVGEEIRDMLK